MNIYVASSWRNDFQPVVVGQLRLAGHDVYDFRHPKPGNDGFSWGDIAKEWLGWTPSEFLDQLTTSPVARAGYRLDKDALDWADVCVLLLPSGRSAHLEAGYMIGQFKPTIILLDALEFEPEMMYLLADKVVTDIGDMLDWVNGLPGTLS